MTDPRLRPHVHDIAFSGVSRLKGDVFFVQIGAADGRRFDPIYYFVRRYGWRGVLVEPLPDIFEMLRANYEGHEGLVFENAAVTEKEETRTISRIPLDKVGSSGVPGWAMGASTLTPEKTRFASENSPEPLHDALSSAVVTEQVNCTSLAALFDRHGVGQLDVLQLDTEGYDANILRQLDFSRYRPSLINMEWQWLTDGEKQEVSSLLGDQGYSLYSCEADLLATQGSIEDFMVAPPPPDVSARPRFFPGIRGFTSKTPVSSLSGAADPFPAQVEFSRSRQTIFSIRGHPDLLPFLSLIDGERSYGEIALMLRRPEGMLLAWGRELQSLFVLE